MKRHGNTLFVTTQGSYLAKERTNIAIFVKKEKIFSIPIHTLDSVVCFGNVSCSPFLMGHCSDNGVSLSFHKENGRFLARAVGRQSGNVLLRRAQHNKTMSCKCPVEFSRIIISAKISNCRCVVQRFRRDHGSDSNSEELKKIEAQLSYNLKSLAVANDIDVLRGIEGESASYYFGIFPKMILGDGSTFTFNGRTRRPPKDSVNALLSFLYSLLTNDYYSACESVGLDPQMGFLHADRPGRPSLALDLMEELRPILADRIALSLINRKQVSEKGFRYEETGGVTMNDETRKQVIVSYQKRKEEQIMHPFLNERITIGLIPFIQARLLARWIRDDLDAYPPFFWR